MDVLKQIANWLSRAPDSAWQPLDADGTGFCAGGVRTNWDQVQSVATFKHDGLTVDDVWFRIETRDGPVMVWEDQPGFADWERVLCSQFPSASAWRAAVLLPPFARNFTVLYRRT